MKISISGSSCTGKTTLVNRFLQRWPMYKTTEKTYRDIIKDNNLSHSSNTTEETQLLILDWMTRELDKNANEPYFIYDRCPWDCLAYTLNANENNKISDEVTAAVIDIAKASYKKLDIIFWLGYDPDIKIVNDQLRDTNLDYIKDIDEIFEGLYRQYADHLGNTPYISEDCPAIIPIEGKGLYRQYANHLKNTPFYISGDCPAIIPIEGKSVDDRIAWIGEFLDEKGDLIETTQSVLDPQNLGLMEQMLKEQGLWKEKDSEFKNIANEIKNFKI